MQKLSSAQGKWYAYDDYGAEYVLTLSDNGSGYSDDGDSFTWEESKDAVTTDDGDVYEKVDGKLQETGESYVYFKSESDAKADYDARVKEMREKCDQYIEALKDKFVGTWAYDNGYGDKGTFVVSDDGTWMAACSYVYFGNHEKENHSGTWSVAKIDDSVLPDFKQYLEINIDIPDNLNYFSPLCNISSVLNTNGNDEEELNDDSIEVIIGDYWTKTSDDADVSKLKSSEKKEKASKSDSEGDTYTLSTTSVTGKKLEGKVTTDADGYVIADSDTHEYTKDELKKLNLNDAELCIAWNEPFARKGHTFGNSALQEYFNHCSWYTAKSSDVSIHGVAATNVKRLQDLLTDSSWKSLSNQKNN